MTTSGRGLFSKAYSSSSSAKSNKTIPENSILNKKKNRKKNDTNGRRKIITEDFALKERRIKKNSEL